MPAPPVVQTASEPSVSSPEVLLRDGADKAPSPVDPPAEPIRRNIEVIATRPGFFKNMRRKEGDKFTIPSMDQIGEWMKCANPVLEKERLVMLAKKKVKIKEAGK
jgi:hypothetical protein